MGTYTEKLHEVLLVPVTGDLLRPNGGDAGVLRVEVAERRPHLLVEHVHIVVLLGDLGLAVAPGRAAIPHEKGDALDVVLNVLRLTALRGS